MKKYEVIDSRLYSFIDIMIGNTPIGVDSEGNEISSPTSPLIRAHLDAIIPNLPSHYYPGNPAKLLPLANYLRSLAQAIDNAVITAKEI